MPIVSSTSTFGVRMTPNETLGCYRLGVADAHYEWVAGSLSEED